MKNQQVTILTLVLCLGIGAAQNQAGEVHVYTDREIRLALLECLRQSLPQIAEAITQFTREPRQVA